MADGLTRLEIDRPTLATRDQIRDKLAVDGTTLTKARRLFPVQWPTDYLDLVDASDPEDPIARMGRPTPAEWQPDPGDLSDPIADQRLRPVPFVVRKYRDRVIILTTKRCHFYCRFCFRREEPVTANSEPNEADWQRIFDYLRENPAITEPILSGGDPLTLSDEKLFWIRDQLTAIPSVTHWRIHTRAPVHYPIRVTQQLIANLAEAKPLTIVTHFNHANEITEESQRIANLCRDHGITIKNQAVLLAGVNDSAEAQRNLWQTLHNIGIAAYYLHHTDPVPGNAHFRVTIERGLKIYRTFRDKLSAPPRYVLDQPNGTGKVDVESVTLKWTLDRHGVRT